MHHITRECIACGVCMMVCEQQAIVEGKDIFHINEQCDDCGVCVDVCPVYAIEKGEE